MKKKQLAGLSLIELLISITIICVVLSFGLPSLAGTLNHKSLSNAVDRLSSDMNFARSEALRTGKHISLTLSQQEQHWCYGITDKQPSARCDCFTEKSCTVDGHEFVVNHAEYRGVTLRYAMFAGTGNFLIFSPERGIAAGNGTARNGSVWFESGNGDLRGVIVSRLGRIRICAEGDVSCSAPAK